MPEQAQSTKSDDEISKQTLRSFRNRYRVCRYLFTTSGVWLLAGVLSFFASFVATDRDVMRLFVRGFEASEAIGFAVFTIALAVTFAFYRCPLCDAFLNPLRADKIRCPSCYLKLIP